MIRAHEIAARGRWTSAPADRVVLDFDARHRRRIAMTGEGGLAFLLDLREATALRDGDGIVLEDGRIVAVAAAAEALIEVRAGDAHHLMRLAWHLGNRHVAAAIEAERILIRPDHVLVAMLEQLGGRTCEIEAPFNPEGGAYGGGAGSGHGHEHPHRHGNGHDHPHGRHE